MTSFYYAQKVFSVKYLQSGRCKVFVVKVKYENQTGWKTKDKMAVFWGQSPGRT
jgi:hypothetical protein